MAKIEDCISFLTGKAYQKINQRARALLLPHGVTPTQYALLSILWDEDGKSGTELASRLILDSAAMTGLVDRSVTLDLVKRVADTNDRRVSRIWLTQHGRRLKSPLSKVIRTLNEEVSITLGPKTAGFHANLKKIAGID